MQPAPPSPALVSRLAEFFGSVRYRPCRVLVLLACIVVFSLADLYMTLVHLLHFGMLEANPLARSIMEYGSPAALILWKLVTVGIAVAIFFWKRDRRAAEWGAAFCCCVLVWLTGRWVTYNLQISDYTQELAEVAGSGEPPWISMSRDPIAGSLPRRNLRGGGTLSPYDRSEIEPAGLVGVVDPDLGGE
jgi:hypothetical protein